VEPAILRAIARRCAPHARQFLGRAKIGFLDGLDPGGFSDIESDGNLKNHELSDDAKAAVLKLVGTRKLLFGRLAPKRELLRDFSAMQKKAKSRQT
jgi:hypothetical protein